MVGELSEDGNWVWDGSKWNPMNHQNPNHITSPNQSRGPPSIKESNRNKTWIQTPPLKEESLDVPSPALSNYQKPPSSKRNGFETIATITAGLIGIVVIVAKLLQFAEFLQSGGKGRR